MYLISLIYLVILVFSAHYVGTEWMNMNPDSGFLSPYGIWIISITVIFYGIPYVFPHMIDFYKGVKNILLQKITNSPVLATILAAIITILAPFIFIYAMLAAIVGAHMLLGWLLGIFKK